MNPESNEALSRRVAEAAGWTAYRDENYWYLRMPNQKTLIRQSAMNEEECWAKNCPPYATSLDAIAALEREAGLRVDLYAMANPDDEYHVYTGRVWASADTEPRARCLAYLAYLAWASKKGRV